MLPWTSQATLLYGGIRNWKRQKAPVPLIGTIGAVWVYPVEAQGLVHNLAEPHCGHELNGANQRQVTKITTMSYSPRILRGRRHFEGPFQIAPSSHLSFQEICHKSDEYPLIRAMGHCKNGWHAQCARRGVCCTVRNQQKHSHYKPLDQSEMLPSSMG